LAVSREQMRRGDPGMLRIGSTLLGVGSLGMLAAPITIVAAMPDLATRTGRHILVGALGLTAVAILECVIAFCAVRRGERWALVAAAIPFLVVGIPIFVVDATYVRPERLWNTLAPQALGLLTGGVALLLCALGRARGAGGEA
jgi:hypothetical protein